MAIALLAAWLAHGSPDNRVKPSSWLASANSTTLHLQSANTKTLYLVLIHYLKKVALRFIISDNELSITRCRYTLGVCSREDYFGAEEAFLMALPCEYIA
jgi:hypothetical protein